MPAAEASAEIVDLAVVGAGPAGLAGAVGAADGGCRVTVLDLGERLGGQYWRHPAPALGGGPTAFHHGWRTYARLQGRFEAHRRAGRIDHLPGHAVWRLEHDGLITARALADERHPRAGTVRARTALVATGAYDRHVPFRGWTLPGVMAVGGAQSLLKGSLMAPGRFFSSTASARPGGASASSSWAARPRWWCPWPG